MAQLNMQMTPEFEDHLARFMRIREIRTKSEAIRVAVVEGLDAAQRGRRATDWGALRGLALRGRGNPAPRFASDDDLWVRDGQERP